MKKNNLTAAVVAGLAGISGIASISHAVNINPEGTGQVLIFPYYSVGREEQADGSFKNINTLISVVNTTDATKAVKVRFLEGKNSREVLDFNLYLSPYDVWTAALKPTKSSIVYSVGDHTGEDSGMLVTNDNSCTSPNNVSGSEFLPYFFEGANDDAETSNLSRATEGHFEVIEMGQIIDAGYEAEIKHTLANADADGDAAPTGCAALDVRWTTGVWATDRNDGFDIATNAGRGGLFGSATLINVLDGTAVSYNASALDAFYDYAAAGATLHNQPGSISPDLSDVSPKQSIVFNNGVATTSTWVATASAADPVSALFMNRNVYAEYEISSDINAKTEWVITFPTKFFYVKSTPALAPFTETFGAGGACEQYNVVQRYDQEEQFPTTAIGGPIVSPPPPDGNPNIPEFCWETNVIQIDQTVTAGQSDVLYSKTPSHLVTPYRHGWVNLDLDPRVVDGDPIAPKTMTDNANLVYRGLPVSGFAVQKYTNGTLAGGTLLSNYAGLFGHRYRKDIQ